MRASAKEIADLFAVEVQLELLPRFNIAPTQEVLAIRARADRQVGQSEREAVYLRWGLIPSWAQDPSTGNPLINARAETLATKSAFRKAFAKRRCLIVADGFYEWQKRPGGKQPFFISRTNGRPFAFAGLYEGYRHGELSIESCTIVTTEANELLSGLHNRMPVILPESQLDEWLNPAQTDPVPLQRLLKPLPSDQLTLAPVSQRVNSPGNEDPQCIEAITEEVPAAPQQKTLFG